MQISGRPLSEGWAYGRVHLVPAIDDKSEGTVTVTIEEARIRAQDALNHPARGAHVAEEILEVYHALLNDPALIAHVEDALRQGLRPGDAIRKAGEHFASQLAALDDPYLRERSQDVRDVAELWIDQLFRVHGSDAVPDQSIVVTSRLTVQQISHWSDAVKGVIVQQGSPTMHAALIAQGLGIPVVAVDNAEDWKRVRTWDWVYVSGDRGTIQRLDGPMEIAKAQNPATPSPTVSNVVVEANIGSLAEARRAAQAGAQGIGLLRTELLFAAEGCVPHVERQTQIFTQLFQVAPTPIIVRTLDMGSDKPLPPWSGQHEPNPALGTRGVRVYRQHPDLFDDHLTAILSAWRPHQPSLSVMFPMISSTSDWHFCKTALERVCRSQNVPHDALGIGVMAEVPALIWLLPDLRREGCQFISIGTNDLSQYLLATDRTIGHGTESPLALARAIAMLVSEAQRQSLIVHVCGGLAAEIHWARYLMGLGVGHLSVPVARLEAIRHALSQPVPTDIRTWTDGQLSESEFAQKLMQL